MNGVTASVDRIADPIGFATDLATLLAALQSDRHLLAGGIRLRRPSLALDLRPAAVDAAEHGTR